MGTANCTSLVATSSGISLARYSLRYAERSSALGIRLKLYYISTSATTAKTKHCLKT